MNVPLPVIILVSLITRPRTSYFHAE